MAVRLLLALSLTTLPVSIAADEAGRITSFDDPRSPPAVVPSGPPASPPPPEPDETAASDPIAEVEGIPVAAETVDPQPFHLLGVEVPPGTQQRLAWYASETTAGLAQSTPVLIAHGSKPGPVLCVTAAVHGDELNGIEVVRQLLDAIHPDKLSGTVIGVPIVNLYGFRQGSRYMADRRDLNRYFPGNPHGSSAARIAYSFFHSIVRHCDYAVDLHSGSFHRTNLPHLRADLGDEKVLHLTRGFGATVVLHAPAPIGSLRRAATDVGIPAVVMEAGEPMRLNTEEIAHGVKALRSLLNHLDMVSTFRLWREPQPTYYKSSWVRAESYGILQSHISLGQTVREDDLLGTVADPITNLSRQIRSPFPGRILGMAVNKSLMPGFAAYHIGMRKTEEELRQEAPGKDEPAVSDEEVMEIHDDVRGEAGVP